MAHKNPNPLASESAQTDAVPVLSDADRTKGATNRNLTKNGRDEELTQKEQGGTALIQTAKPRMISERKLQANRANAKKSTGPRTARGKAYSSRNAQKHGLLSQASLFGPDGTPIDPELRAVWARLREEYGKDDAGTDALLRKVVAEWSHQSRALELEDGCLRNAKDDSSSTVSLSKLQRYRTTSQRSLLKNLARLHRGPERTR